MNQRIYISCAGPTLVLLQTLSNAIFCCFRSSYILQHDTPACVTRAPALARVTKRGCKTRKVRETRPQARSIEKNFISTTVVIAHDLPYMWVYDSVLSLRALFPPAHFFPLANNIHVRLERCPCSIMYTFKKVCVILEI